MIKPVYSTYDYQEGRWIFGLSEEDFGKVQKGYGCGNCLEDYQGKWLPKCPVCGVEVKVVVDLPDEWRRSGVPSDVS